MWLRDWGNRPCSAPARFNRYPKFVPTRKVHCIVSLHADAVAHPGYPSYDALRCQRDAFSFFLFSAVYSPYGIVTCGAPDGGAHLLAKPCTCYYSLRTLAARYHITSWQCLKNTCTSKSNHPKHLLLNIFTSIYAYVAFS